LPLEYLAMQENFAAAISRPATGALRVYRNTVMSGAVQALRDNFPVVEQIVGTEMFEAVAVDFAATCPPRTPVLALYGSEFADWVGHQPWIADLPYLADVARVERLRIESLFASDAEPLFDLPRQSEMISARIQIHPATRFAWLSTPAMSIWLAHQQPDRRVIEPDWKPEGALFARPSAFTMHAPRIGRAAHRLLCGIRFGETIGQSVAAAERLHPQENPAAILASLANLGVFAAPDIERN